MRFRAFVMIVVLTCLAFGGTVIARDDKNGSLEPLVQLLVDIDDAAFQRDILNGVHKAINGRRNVAMPPSWKKVSKSLLASKDAKVREMALQLGVIFGDPAAFNAMRKLAGDPTKTVAARQSALTALLQKRDPNTFALLKSLLNDNAMRAAAIRGFATFDSQEGPQLLLKLYPKLSQSEKQDVLATLASRPQFALALMTAIEQKKIPSTEVSAFLIRQISTFNDKSLNQRIQKVWGSVRPLKKERAKLIARYKQQLTAKVLKQANRRNGRLIFRKTCAVCHRLFDEGKKIGPDLTGGQRSNLDYLLENILDPNAVIGRDYRMTIFVTESGRLINGIVKEESAKTITLQTANETLSLDKADIEIRKQSPLSLMPEGQLEKMRLEEIRDLLGYLMGATQVKLPSGK